jgi:hypothetical protein
MVFCEICNVNTSNIKTHSLTKKHQNGGKRDAMSEEQLKDYHKKYYVTHNLKDKYKEKKKCEVCDKQVAKYNWSKHIQTEKHFKKEHEHNNPTEPYVRHRLLEDPLTVKEEDIEDESDKESIIISSEEEIEVSMKPKKYLKKVPKPPTKIKNKDNDNE